MSHLDQARKILNNTETSLRELIERALAEQHYAEVADIARLADSVAHLVRGNGAVPLVPSATSQAIGDTESDDPIVAPATANDVATVRATRRHRPAKDEYPRFEREADKLIKIGWSKRDGRVYEHRAPKDTVFLVTTALASKMKPKAIFTMDQLLPLNDNGGNEVPSYQAYLALAWLRSIGVVQRRGKDGYSIASGSLEPPKLQRLWAAVPNRD